MNILILGSGGREHVFARKISESPLCSHLYIAPGNAGTMQCGTNVNLSPLDFKSVEAFCIEKQIGLLIPAAEDPLVAGIVDFLKSNEQLADLMILGPAKAGAMLEGSKDFSKLFMLRHGIPTAAYKSITMDNLDEGLVFLEQMESPYVLKADGLAAGKGVLIEKDLDTAKSALKEILGGKFGKAGNMVVIEEFLHGIEMSCFVLTDGTDYVMLPEAKDYKRIGEGDEGLNTGGMGAVSPVPFADRAFIDKVENSIVKPTIRGLQEDGIPYCGFIFIGLMNSGGEPRVIEYNCRMGDPETEVVLHRVENDLVELFIAACRHGLGDIKLKVNPQTAVTVVLVSGGYPGEFARGFVIRNLEEVRNSTIYHAGTKSENGHILTNGGRVMAITSTGNNIREAISASLENAEKVDFNNMYYRKDIGQDLLKYNEQI